jgi:peroxiredoxin
VKRHGLTYPTLVDPSVTVARLYRVAEYPAAVVIDRRGKVRFVHRGFRSGEEQLLERMVRATLAGNTQAVRGAAMSYLCSTSDSGP